MRPTRPTQIRVEFLRETEVRFDFLDAEDRASIGLPPLEGVRRVPEPHGLTVLAIAAAIALVGFMIAAALSGCGVTAEDKKLVAEIAVITSKDLAEWKTLTDEQKLRAHWRAARGFNVLDWAWNDRPLHAQWKLKEPPR